MVELAEAQISIPRYLALRPSAHESRNRARHAALVLLPGRISAPGMLAAVDHFLPTSFPNWKMPLSTMITGSSLTLAPATLLSLLIRQFSPRRIFCYLKVFTVEADDGFGSSVIGVVCNVL